eukprot:g18315.t1
MPELKLGLNDKLLFEQTGRPMSKGKSVEMEDIKFHQCVRLARTISFIPPDGEFELMSYRLNTHVKPLIWIESAIDLGQSKSRIEYMIRAKSQFKSRSVANNVEVIVPVPSDVDSPSFKTSIGTVKYCPDQDAIVWSIKQFQGQKDFIMTANFGLPSIGSETREEYSKKPINVKFEIPYFTVSGVTVRYLKILEKSGYQALPWVRERLLRRVLQREEQEDPPVDVDKEKDDKNDDKEEKKDEKEEKKDKKKASGGDSDSVPEVLQYGKSVTQILQVIKKATEQGGALSAAKKDEGKTETGKGKDTDSEKDKDEDHKEEATKVGGRKAGETAEPEKQTEDEKQPADKQDGGERDEQKEKDDDAKNDGKDDDAKNDGHLGGDSKPGAEPEDEHEERGKGDAEKREGKDPRAESRRNSGGKAGEDDQATGDAGKSAEEKKEDKKNMAGEIRFLRWDPPRRASPKNTTQLLTIAGSTIPNEAQDKRDAEVERKEQRAEKKEEKAEAKAKKKQEEADKKAKKEELEKKEEKEKEEKQRDLQERRQKLLKFIEDAGARAGKSEGVGKLAWSPSRVYELSPAAEFGGYSCVEKRRGVDVDLKMEENTIAYEWTPCVESYDRAPSIEGEREAWLWPAASYYLSLFLPTPGGFTTKFQSEQLLEILNLDLPKKPDDGDKDAKEILKLDPKLRLPKLWGDALFLGDDKGKEKDDSGDAASQEGGDEGAIVYLDVNENQRVRKKGWETKKELLGPPKGEGSSGLAEKIRAEVRRQDVAYAKANGGDADAVDESDDEDDDEDESSSAAKDKEPKKDEKEKDEDKKKDLTGLVIGLVISLVGIVLGVLLYGKGAALYMQSQQGTEAGGVVTAEAEAAVAGDENKTEDGEPDSPSAVSPNGGDTSPSHDHEEESPDGHDHEHEADPDKTSPKSKTEEHDEDEHHEADGDEPHLGSPEWSKTGSDGKAAENSKGHAGDGDKDNPGDASGKAKAADTVG